MGGGGVGRNEAEGMKGVAKVVKGSGREGQTRECVGAAMGGRGMGQGGA